MVYNEPNSIKKKKTKKQTRKSHVKILNERNIFTMAQQYCLQNQTSSKK